MKTYLLYKTVVGRIPAQLHVWTVATRLQTSLGNLQRGALVPGATKILYNSTFVWIKSTFFDADAKFQGYFSY